MSWVRRNRSIIAATLAAAVVSGAVAWRTAGVRPVRYFIPGELGRGEVPVRVGGTPMAGVAGVGSGTAPERRGWEGPGSAGFLTRCLTLRAGEESEWGMRNGTTEGIPFSHNLGNVFPPALASSHLEFFPFADGKRLVAPAGAQFWNPDLGREDVAAFAAEQARSFFATNPRAVSFSLGVNDGLVYGESPEALALMQPQQWFRGRPDYSRLVFTFMNRAAADLARTHSDKYLGCLAYYWCENVPPFPVDPHVIPFYTADHAQSYDPAFRAEEFEMQRKWAAVMGRDRKPEAGGRKPEVGGEQPESKGADSIADKSAPTGDVARRLGLYDYLDDYGFLVPRVPVRAFAENIRHAHEVGFTDYFGESSRNWGLDGPMPWVIAQLLRSPRQDVDALLDEYYAGYFQEAAAPMRRFFERCEEQWMRQPGPAYWLKHYRNESQAVLFPSNVCAELRQLLAEAEAAAGDKETGEKADVASPVRRRVAFVSDAFGVTERFVRLCEARTALTAGLLRNELRGDALRKELDRYVSARADFVGYTQEVGRRWPLAFHPINYADFLKNEPGFAAAMALAEQQNSAVPLPASQLDPEKTSGVDDFSLSPARRAGQIRVAQRAVVSLRDAGGREVCVDGALAGQPVRGRRIAGLAFGIDLPRPWQSVVEPTQKHSAVIASTTTVPGEPRVLRISGAVLTFMYQWIPAKPGTVYLASVDARAHVSSSNGVTLLVSWLDAKQKPVGASAVMRLPDGNWPDWVTLRQGGEAPAGAAWIAIGACVNNQVDGDWAEFRGFSLREEVR